MSEIADLEDAKKAAAEPEKTDVDTEKKNLNADMW